MAVRDIRPARRPHRTRRAAPSLPAPTPAPHLHLVVERLAARIRDLEKHQRRRWRNRCVECGEKYPCETVRTPLELG